MPADVVADACLLVSELVTNAAQHAHTMITLVVACDGAHIAVSVGDDVTRGLGSTRAIPEPANEGGRGLVIVDAVAGAWGVNDRPDGKIVWFRVP